MKYSNIVLKHGDLIENKQHPEWGTFKVRGEYAPHIIEIAGDRGESVLDMYEFDKFWRVVKILKGGLK